MPVRENRESFPKKMTVVKKLDESESQSTDPFYVRIQNVPSSAGQKDVRDFFSGLTIPNGGISFNGKSAYIVFYNSEDAFAAVQMSRRRLLLGMVMRVSNVGHREMRRSQMESVRRKLVLNSSVETVVPAIHTDQLQNRPSKRIRPTTVISEVGKSVATKFCPDEIEGDEEGQSISQRVASTVSSRSVRRKQNLKTIKPTPVVSLEQFNLFYEQEVF